MKKQFHSYKIRTGIILLLSAVLVLLMVSFIVPYVCAKAIIGEKMMVSVSKLMSQVSDRVQSFYHDIDVIATSCIYNPTIQEFVNTNDSSERLLLKKSVMQILSNTMSLKEDIKGIRLYDNNGVCIAMDDLSSFFPDEFAMDNKIHDTVVTGIYPGAIGRPPQSRYYYLICVPIYYISKETIREQIGVCAFIMDIENYNQIVNNLLVTPNSRIAILDQNNAVVADPIRSNIGKKTTESHLIDLEGWGRENSKTELIRQKLTIPDTSWSIMSEVPVDELTEDLELIARFGIISFTVAVILLSLIIIFFSNGITKPIQALVKFMQSIPENGLYKETEIAKPYEIKLLADNLNKMLERIDRLTKEIASAQEKMYNLQISQKHTELNALQSQINPHFLYNTLECIRGIAISYNANEIVEISEAMSSLFRYCVKKTNIVLVGEELVSLENYLRIIALRFLGRFQTSIDADENALSVNSLKMILQPIVENAIYHGLENKVDGGFVAVRITLRDSQTVQYEIADNGIGIDKEVLDEINSRLIATSGESEIQYEDNRSIGLINIYQRLKLHYGQEAEMTIMSAVNDGTKVVISFPVRRDANV